MQNEELAKSAKEAWLAAERDLEQEARSFATQKRSQKSIDAEVIAKDLQLVKMQTDIEDLKHELIIKEQEIRRLSDLQEKSSQSSVDEAIRGYLKAPYQEELQYWRELALKSSQRGSFEPQRVEEAFTMRLSALEEEFHIKENELNKKDELISQREKELIEMKYTLQSREGQIRVKEAQLRASREDLDRMRSDIEDREREMAEHMSTFTFSATQRGQIDSDLRKELEEFENQVVRLEKELEQSREQYIESKRIENDLQAKNQALHNQIQGLNLKLHEFEEKEKAQASQGNLTTKGVGHHECSLNSSKRDLLDSFLNKINYIVEKTEEIFKDKETISPVISSLFTRIASSRSSPHVQLSLLPSLLSNLLSSLSLPPVPPLKLPEPTIQKNSEHPSEDHLTIQPPASLETKLLSALNLSENKYKQLAVQLEDHKKVLDALVDGWTESGLKLAVADALSILAAARKIESGEGDPTLAHQKTQAALLCVSRLASSIGQNRLSKAVKRAHAPQCPLPGPLERTKESREQSLELDEKLLFLSRQAHGRPSESVHDN
jgi:hypothetical protein